MEEMGMQADLKWVFDFTYRAEFESGLVEHELDHVFFGQSDLLPVINRNEVETFKYVNLESLKDELQLNPQDYTPWLKICLEKVMEHFTSEAK